MKKYLASLLALVSLSLYGQKIEVIPPSPEAASAFKFAEVPVSLYTGVPSTSIEIHRIKTKGVTVPVTLSYHSRGNRVEEIASRVGLGWALSYGGMVSRQVRGRADDATWGMMYQPSYNEMFTSEGEREEFYDQIVQHEIDKTPDQFFLDMNGESAKFIIDQTDGEVLLQHKGDICIKPVLKDGTMPVSWGTTDIIGWVVTDKHGNTFYYGCSEDKNSFAIDVDLTVSKSFNHMGNIATVPDNEQIRPNNTWHLMEIVTPYGERIEFIYAEEEARSVRKSFDALVSSDPGNPYSPKYPVSHFSEVTSHQHQVEEIRFPNGRVVFTKGEERDDLASAWELGKISIFQGEDVLLREYDLFHSYTAADPKDQNLIDHLRKLDPESEKRLFLDSLQERGSDGSTKPPHRFTYDPTVLPNRFSTSQDAWGYYNGKPNGRFLTFYDYNTSISREVDTLKAAAGLLQRITYPTGGSVEFAYEHNKATPPAYFDRLHFPEINPTEEPETELLYASGKRIRRITYRNLDGTVQVKEYAYQGGRSFGLPSFYYIAGTAMKDGQEVAVIDAYGSVPGSPLSNLQGNSVGYRYVTEYNGDGETHQGLTDYEFTVTEDGGTFYRFPYPLPNDNEWLRGKPVSTRVYAVDPKRPELYVQKRSVEHTYLYGGSSYTPSLFVSNPPVAENYSYSRTRTRFVRPFLIPTSDYVNDKVGNDNPVDLVWEPFYLMGGTVDLYRTVETEYFTDGTRLRSQTTYHYDYERHYQQAGAESTDSRGRTVRTATTYPTTLEASARTAAEKQLVDRHRVATPLRVETTVLEGQDVLASTVRRTTYRNDWGSSGLSLPGTVETSVDAGPWRQEAVYGTYDSGGNPLQVRVREGEQTCYLWGYGGTLPVAQVQNASYADVEAALGGAGAVQAISESPALSQAQLDQLGALRALLPEAMVTTYTYTYAPLEGMTSATDSNGRTTRYQYDGFGRLEVVMDHEGNVVKTYQYHYYEGR